MHSFCHRYIEVLLQVAKVNVGGWSGLYTYRVLNQVWTLGSYSKVLFIICKYIAYRIQPIIGTK